MGVQVIEITCIKLAITIRKTMLLYMGILNSAWILIYQYILVSE